MVDVFWEWLLGLSLGGYLPSISWWVWKEILSVVRVRGPGMSVVRLDRSCECKGFIMRPLREKCNVAVKGTLEEVLLSSLPNITIGSVGVSKILRRFSAMPNIGRSIARVVLTLGRLSTAVSNRNDEALGVRTRKPYAVGKSSVVYPPSIRMLDGSLRVTALSRGSGFGVRVRMSGNEKCISTRRGGARRVPVNILPMSSVCAPIRGMDCRIRGAEMNRGSSCSGLVLRI